MCLVIFLINPVLFSFAQAKEEKQVPFSDKRPLTLQWEVSHPRNTDQISLIFRQDIVELVTNTSSYQKGKTAQLGRFETPLNAELKALKAQLEWYYMQLKKTVPLSSLIKDSRFRPIVDPHAPVLYINEEKVQNSEAPYFKSLASIIYKVWERRWVCIECAFYKKKRKSIIRTVKRLKKDSNRETAVVQGRSKVRKKWETRRQKFSKKLLDCIPKGKNKVECIDPQFGIFEI